MRKKLNVTQFSDCFLFEACIIIIIMFLWFLNSLLGTMFFCFQFICLFLEMIFSISGFYECVQGLFRVSISLISGA